MVHLPIKFHVIPNPLYHILLTITVFNNTIPPRICSAFHPLFRTRYLFTDEGLYSAYIVIFLTNSSAHFFVSINIFSYSTLFHDLFFRWKICSSLQCLLLSLFLFITRFSRSFPGYCFPHKTLLDYLNHYFS